LRVSPELKAAIQACAANTIFHLHGGLLPEFYAVTRELRRKRLPWVLTPQGCYDAVALGKRKWQKKAYIALMDRKVLAQAHRVHALSVGEADSVREITPDAKVVVVPNGQDALVPGPVPAPDGSVLTIGFCGRLDRRHKGLDLLIEAFGSWRPRGKARLWLIGDGEHRQWLEARALELGLGDRFQIFGSLFGQEKAARLNQFDVFIHSSRHEGMPTAMLEAAAHGLPLIASEATHLGDYIREWKCGRVLAANTVAELREAFTWAEASKRSGQLAELGQRAQAMIAERFRWDVIAQEIQAELYQV